ncbi:sensor domain-containing protein [Aliarcobacter vitoriensis]|uniref:GGDEF domain-containing protein n=1 Tax=Aliarcobacter vitoriensis TaxID=2011099 RepID=A0A366MU35_9BACT|nr:bifunctional diguanylate cyclase/phosphodiesterase [Aliarcobacter vitoriensis]RBQ29130.1 GGDEF domain-containing protein [Aliarcobacter vitoriensis]RBQ32519.1 GGDEF domain-containing protein [Arcobacter sp. FW59]
MNNIKSKTLLKLISKHSPDMLWVKDLEGKYLYANSAICTGLLMATEDEVLGNTDIFFAKREREKYKDNKEWHTFGELCKNTDEETIKVMKPSRFLEYGNIKGKMTYLQVDKAPFFNKNNELVGIIGTARDITEETILKEKNNHLMYFDQLTSLPNRQKIIIDILEKNPTSCIIFNIDDFKEVNDFFGTQNADQILKDVAQRFIDYKYDTYRIDGDEFAVLFFDDKSLENLKKEAQNILNLLDEKPFYIEDKEILIGFSVGIAKSNDNLLTKADIAVNNAKTSDNHICIYDENHNIEEKYKENIELAAEIKDAILENRIVCYYQPLLNIENGEIYSYESLVRMIDKKGNLISPLKFLKFSKKIRLYSSITKKVVEEACKTFQDRDENFSINLSIDDIKDSQTVDFILKTIKKTKTAPKVTFEILESEGIENYNEVITFINKIKKLGARIAIDDFGTGYSNFEHILRLDVDYIKIDGSLIKNIVEDDKHRLIVETIVSFAKRIGIKTVAEFVSDDEILKTIKNIGITCAQGFHIGKPESF